LFTLLAWAMGIGAAVNVAVALAVAGPPTIELRAGYWIGPALSRAPGVGADLQLFYPVVRKIGPAKAAYSAVLVPIIAMGFSTWLEDYRWTWLAVPQERSGARRNGRRAEPPASGCGRARRRLSRSMDVRVNAEAPQSPKPFRNSARGLPPAGLAGSPRSSCRSTSTSQSTRVRAKLTIERNGEHDRPLRLDGDGIEPFAVRADGAEAEWRMDGPALVVPLSGDRATVETEVVINPAANTKLMGLYASGGMLCTQCESEGFRRITFFPDRPDVLSSYRVRMEAGKAPIPGLLTNGNPIASGETGEDGRHWAEWEDPFPKPSYLFALVAGDLKANSDSFTTMSGRKVELNIWVREEDLPGPAMRWRA
jgi:hypothetical protein